MRELRFTGINRILSKFNRALPAQRWKLRSANPARIVDFSKLLKSLVPRAGVEPARPYGQRILRTLSGLICFLVIIEKKLSPKVGVCTLMPLSYLNH